MRAPARFYTRHDLIEAILADESVHQLVNVATLPGIDRYALAMPDMHQGYGFPIGGVAPIRTADGVISPGGVGYDINCGVRLLLAPLHRSEVADRIADLATQLSRDIPSGVGRGGEFVLSDDEMDAVLRTGCRWALEKGYATEEDLEYIEEGGSYEHADSGAVSLEAKQRGRDQLGTIGSGNHFVEVQAVAEILDPRGAALFGLFPGQVAVMIHTGSRGLGHQTCTDYVRLMNTVIGGYGITLPDRELSCAPFLSSEGQRYFQAMAAAANFAWTNRQVITYVTRRAFERCLADGPTPSLRLLYDVSHNIAKLETHSGVEYIMHRKGATRAFGPGRAEVPARYREYGQPVIIPGSMGTCSYVLRGTESGMQVGFGSSCHGAGRQLSRMRARKTIDYNRLRRDLAAQGIVVRAASSKGLLEEAPEAYKDVTAVIDVVAHGGLAVPVARLTPLAVIKG
jgi:tRNA-splicing ligase RtcB